MFMYSNKVHVDVFRLSKSSLDGDAGLVPIYVLMAQFLCSRVMSRQPNGWGYDNLFSNVKLKYESEINNDYRSEGPIRINIVVIASFDREFVLENRPKVNVFLKHLESNLNLMWDQLVQQNSNGRLHNISHDVKRAYSNLKHDIRHETTALAHEILNELPFGM